MGRTWTGVFFKDPEKHCDTGSPDAAPGWNAALFHLYISPEENEQTIEYLLQEYPEFKICEMEGYEGFADGMPQVTESQESGT